MAEAISVGGRTRGELEGLLELQMERVRKARREMDAAVVGLRELQQDKGTLPVVRCVPRME